MTAAASTRWPRVASVASTTPSMEGGQDQWATALADQTGHGRADDQGFNAQGLDLRRVQKHGLANRPGQRRWEPKQEEPESLGYGHG